MKEAILKLLAEDEWRKRGSPTNSSPDNMWLDWQIAENKFARLSHCCKENFLICRKIQGE